jgi:hypothetical protein
LSVSYYRLKQQQREAAGRNTSGALIEQIADPSMSNLELPDQ